VTVTQGAQGQLVTYSEFDLFVLRSFPFLCSNHSFSVNIY
jgi:hypothetical protein